MLIFCDTKAGCAWLGEHLYSQYRIPCTALHGDLEQTARDRAIQNFKRRHIPVMVSTGVAARDLDVEGIKTVVNYDPAGDGEDHVRRIRCTGRGGEKGYAYTMLTPKQSEKAKDIVRPEATRSPWTGTFAPGIGSAPKVTQAGKVPVPPELAAFLDAVAGASAVFNSGVRLKGQIDLHQKKKEEIQDKLQQLREKESQLQKSQKEAQLQKEQKELREKEAQLAQKEAQLQKEQKELKEKEAQLAQEKEARLAQEKQAQLAQAEALQKLRQEAREKQAQQVQKAQEEAKQSKEARCTYDQVVANLGRLPSEGTLPVWRLLPRGERWATTSIRKCGFRIPSLLSSNDSGPNMLGMKRLSCSGSWKRNNS